MRLLLKVSSYIFAFLPFFLFGYFLFWVIRVVIPLTFVEAKYQYKIIQNEIVKRMPQKNLFFPSNLLKLHYLGSKYSDAGISIPKIFLDEPIIFNVDPNNSLAYTQALKKGIAHASGTAFPGELGLGYYFAHSASTENVSQYNAVFYLLGKLDINDEIHIWKNGEKYQYIVTTKIVTSPKDTSFLKLSYSEQTIVLQTCWPPGTSVKRLLVFAERKI